MTNLAPDLAALGNALEEGARVDLAVTKRRLPRRRLLIAAVVAAVAIPSIAIGADQLISSSQVAASMPAGTLALGGTDPTCTVVKEDVEFHCTLAKAPTEFTDANGNPAYLGTVEPTVDSTKHVNGGCRSLNQDGTEWECYIGEAAVQQKIIGQGFLGQLSYGPGVG